MKYIWFKTASEASDSVSPYEYINNNWEGIDILCGL